LNWRFARERLRRLGSISSAAIVVLLLSVCSVAMSERLSAQVRPDSTKRDTLPVKRDTTKKDTVRIAVPVPVPVVPGAPKPGSPEDSLMQARVIARTDSIRTFLVGDTVRAPIARFESPPSFDIEDRLRLDRKQILSSGAINLADLLDRVPGATTFRSSWMAGLHTASYNGDFARVRVFLDGIEMDAVEARNGGVLDLNDVALWTLDELMIERVAGEVRVWLRSWSYTKTIPFTRADIFTGDRNTNGFRGLFARRFRNAFILQIGAQQAATQTGRVSAFTTSGTTRGAGDGSAQVINARIGWSRKLLTVDLYGTVTTRDRDAHEAREDFTSLPSFKGARREGYLRVGFGDTISGFWSQAIASVLATRLDGIADTTQASVVSDTDSVAIGKPDSLRSRSQQLLAIGYRAGWWQASLLNRVRAVGGRTFHSPAVRASIGSSRLLGGLYAEQRGIDSTTRIDLSGRAVPIPWLILSLSHSIRSPTRSTERASTATSRAEAGLRLRGLFLSGGVMREDTLSYASPTILGASEAALIAGPATAVIGGVHGRLYKDVRLDIQGIRWNTAQFGRPQTSVRTELSLVSDWLRKFPKGQFSFNSRLIYERRDGVPFFYGLAEDGTAAIRNTVPSNVLSGLVEIRIQRATLFYLYRNLTGGDYEQIPGLKMPPSVQMYGVRWEFFN